MKTLSLVILFAMVFAGYCVGRANANPPAGVTGITVNGTRVTGEVELIPPRNMYAFASRDEKTGVSRITLIELPAPEK